MANQAVATIDRGIVDIVARNVEQLIQRGELQVPVNYSAHNAIMSWWLLLQETKTSKRDGERPVLDHCSQQSIGNATMRMVEQGLHPGKKQCYPIAYGKRLECQRSYFGDAAVVLRIYTARGYPDATVSAEVVYEGDTFGYQIEGGRKTKIRHEQQLKNVVPSVDKVVAGYCVVASGGALPDYTVIRTIAQIKKAWEKSKTWKPGEPGTFHEDSPDHAVRRTVIRRACTEILNAADDRDRIGIGTLVRAALGESVQIAAAEMDVEVAENANQEVIALPDRKEPKAAPDAKLSQAQINSLRIAGEQADVQMVQVEELYDMPIKDLTGPTADALEVDLRLDIAKLAAAAKAAKKARG